MGFLGIFFATVGFYSFHEELSNNYNVLLFNPTLIVLLYFKLVKNKKWIINLAVFNLVLIGIYLIVMLNKAHLLILIPLMLTSLILLVKLIFQNRKPISVVI
ncbi:MAG TPA: hypothetical protein DCS19_01155 [Flavobacterium sp.]|nr:hypothetical protein [Flavobacterium sp.]